MPSLVLTPTTIVYKQVDNISLFLDFYPPQDTTNRDGDSSSGSHDYASPVPALIYFHGGGLTVGDRKSWFPTWLYERVTSVGIAFISAEYRLIPPSTGHDILDDIHDLFAFFASPNATLHLHPPPDPARFAVAGTSAGALCAYLAAAHVRPAPRAVLSMYGLGGDFLTPHYLTAKTTPFFRGRELLDPAAYADWLYPASARQPATSGVPLAYSSVTGRPAHPRMVLARLYLQLGVFLDYYTGIHEPSLSGTLQAGEEVPAAARVLFPQLHVTESWPPTLCVHGAQDTAVRIGESESLVAALQRVGARGRLRVVDGEEHSFDYQEGAEDKFGKPGGLFEECSRFVVEELKGDGKVLAN
ncbi:alpha/beta-hydrolase [Dentipellis sp. KUC8613]|nr:alpha/beta-hydrolase [Dentipellis sp. KUC8613]